MEARTRTDGHDLLMGMPRYWTQERIVDAIVEWHLEHGRIPAAGDWSVASPYHPHAVAVTDVFGTWNAGIMAAGFTPRLAKRRGVRWGMAHEVA